jgi:hypothetical protein
MGRVGLEARGRVFLARLLVGDRRFDDAVRILQPIPQDAEQSIGRELQAHTRYWRSVALAGAGNTEAAQSEAERSRMLLEEIQASLPEPDRARYAGRPDIRRLLATLNSRFLTTGGPQAHGRRLGSAAVMDRESA